MERRLFLLTPVLMAIPRLRAATLPKQILIIRHAEKTPSKTDPHLAPEGVKRAAVLARLFDGQFARPAFIIASAPSKHSNRPIETVTPLSRVLHLPIDSRYPEEDVQALAKELLGSQRYSNATVLICWHHGMIPALATALKVTDHPPHWPDTRFDRVWKIEYAQESVKFSDLPQHLLPGDSE